MSQQATRVRRSAEEVKAARLDRQSKLEAKALARQEKFKLAAEKARLKAENAANHRQAIESNVSTRAEKQPAPTIKESTMKRIQREVRDFVKQLSETHGVVFADATPRATRRGSGISLHLSGQIAGLVNTTKNIVGASREATRFMQNAKLSGIKPSVLGKEIQLAGQDGSFKVMGMKGRNNTIVLQKVGDDKAEPMLIPADQFRVNMVSA